MPTLTSPEVPALTVVADKRTGAYSHLVAAILDSICWSHITDRSDYFKDIAFRVHDAEYDGQDCREAVLKLDYLCPVKLEHHDHVTLKLYFVLRNNFAGDKRRRETAVVAEITSGDQVHSMDLNDNRLWHSGINGRPVRWTRLLSEDHESRAEALYHMLHGRLTDLLMAAR